MIKTSVPAKVVAGYLAVVAALVVAVVMIYRYNRSVADIDRNERVSVERRDITSRLVYQMMETSNLEGGLYLGFADNWPAYSTSVDTTLAVIDSLKRAVGSGTLSLKADTLKALVMEKRRNTLAILRSVAGRNMPGAVQRKLKTISAQGDSAVVSTRTPTTSREVVYEVVKRKKSFLGRLADAFKGNRPDTVARKESLRRDSAMANQTVDITDDIVGVLSDINKEDQQVHTATRQAMARNERQQRQVGILLKGKIDTLLRSLKDQETALRRAAIESATQRRHSINLQLGGLAVAAVLLAMVMLLLAWRDSNRARRYRRQRERLLLAITHDIKSPVASITGFIGMLRPLVTNPKAAGYLHDISESASHLMDLVTSILNYHQLERGLLQPQSVSFDSGALVSECARRALPQAEAKGLRLVCLCKSHPCKGDALRIRQIIDNLVANAIKYTRQGQVDVKACVTDHMLHVTVADTGPGMGHDEQARIFDAFTRLPNSDGQEGVGLGLSITRELVSMLSGTISVSSALGRGTTFSVSLPVGEGEQQQGGVRQQEAGEPSPLREGPFTMVVIDDDQLQLKLTAEMVRQIYGKQCALHCSRRVAEALQSIHAHMPDVLLTDVEMPEMSGTQLAASIHIPGMRMVAMTAHDESVRQGLLSAGFSDCLFKPFTASALERAVGYRAQHGLSDYDDNKVNAADDNGNHDDVSMVDEISLAPFLAFACGDGDAERAILESLKEDIDHQLVTIKKAAACNDRSLISQVAHKMLPKVKMASPGHAGAFIRLSPRCIGGLSSGEVATCCEAAAGVMEAMAGAVASRLNR